ncbi:acyltransferase family protein [Sphingomonas hankookensis]|nr:acyltransferase family protein [Sphingomonas hankookensis]PZT92519.1 MAG: acyltransferase [Sphingomonas sp.]WCP72124.1 acyltransferase family protein [Sphingomonas hankookensis]
MSASTYFSSSPAISLPRSFLPMRRRGGLASGIFTNDASGGASAIILLPDETLQQAKNTAASALFASNIYFYTQFDYFDASSEFNALLHTWSLSVEEQFYIFFPPLLAFVHRRFPAALKPLVGFILVITLILSQWRLATDPSAAFYLVQYRTWELMIGSVLALGMIPESRGGVVADVVGAIGLGCIGASALLLTKISSFPGINAAPACIGAACLIWSGSARRTLAGRLLSIPPARFFGKISYSLYLWHWPIWVLGNQVYEPRNSAGRLVYIAIAIIAATLSWRFVEQPFRKRDEAVSSKRVVAIGVGSMLFVLAFAAATPFVARAYWQVPARVERVAKFINYRADDNFRVGSCFLTTRDTFASYARDTCLPISSTKPNYLLLGDSHAAHFLPGMMAQRDLNLLQATASGCRPVADPTGERRCTALMHFITDEFLPRHRMDTVIISARWANDDWPALRRQIEHVRRYANHVIIFGPIAEYDRALPRVLATALYRNDPSVLADHRVADRRALDAEFKRKVPTTGAIYVSVYDAICPDGRCTLWTADGNPVQSDYGHLSAEGSKLMIDRIRRNHPFPLK